MSDIDRYLNTLCWAMGGTLAEQQAVRDELRAHIAEQARELQLSGATPGDAVAQALRDLGDAEQLGRSMRGSRGSAPLRRPLSQPAGALILGPRRAYHLPRAGVALAFAASGAAMLAVAILYLWPG